MRDTCRRLARVAEKMADALQEIADEWEKSSGDSKDGEWIDELLQEYDDLVLERIQQRLDDYDTERRGNQYAAD